MDHPYLVVHAAGGKTFDGKMLPKNMRDVEVDPDIATSRIAELLEEPSAIEDKPVAVCGICQDGVLSAECAVGGKRTHVQPNP